MATARLRGDEEQLYRRYHPRLLRAVAALVGAPHATVEDACAFAWLTLLRCQPERDTTFAWLKRTAVREAWKLAARERRDARLDDVSPPDPDLRACHHLDDAIEAREALTMLVELPARQARYLSLLIAGYSYDEIVAITGTSYTNVISGG